MKGLIKASLDNPYAVIVMGLTISILGALALFSIPVDILPVFRSPAVQILTFYGGMPAEGIETDISLRMEKWTGQANGMKRQESRSITGTSIVRNYFQDGQDPNGALTQVNSLALATLPYLPPGTLPPVVLPFDPTSSTPIALIAMDSKKIPEVRLYDVGRLEVRNFVMQNPGAVAPVVIGGKLRAIMLYLDQGKMQARNLSPADVMDAVERYLRVFPQRRRQDREPGHRPFPPTPCVPASGAHGRHPDSDAPGPVRIPEPDRPAEGLVVHPDEHRARERPPAGLHSRLSSGRLEHLGCRRYAQDCTAGNQIEAQRARHRPQVGDGSVGLRARIDPGVGSRKAA